MSILIFLSLSSLLLGSQFLIVREAQAQQQANVQNCPEGQVLWEHGANANKCVQYYCGQNGDHDPDGNCIPCSSGKWAENGGSCVASNQVQGQQTNVKNPTCPTSNDGVQLVPVPHTVACVCPNHPERGHDCNYVANNSGGTSCSFTVPDAPSVLPQTQSCPSNTCWASAITMMLSYRDHQRYSVDEAMMILGGQYYYKYKNNVDLSNYDLYTVLSKLGLNIQPMDLLSPSQLKNALQKYGPIMMIYAPSNKYPNNFHARIIIGISGDCSDYETSKVRTLDPLYEIPRDELFSTFEADFSNSPNTVFLVF